jgi:uncharacterized iron-regulated membrane protein
MTNIPDWSDIANNLIANAIWASPFVGWYAWKHRRAIVQTLSKPRHIKRTVTDQIGLTDNVQPVLLSGSLGAKLTYRGELTVDRPSLAKRRTDEGLELLSWYLRQA